MGLSFRSRWEPPPPTHRAHPVQRRRPRRFEERQRLRSELKNAKQAICTKKRLLDQQKKEVESYMLSDAKQCDVIDTMREQVREA